MESTTEIFSNIIRNGDVVFDIGANVGSKTVIYRKLGAKVICCEPQPECVAVLRQLFSNDLEVEILDVGLGSSPHQGSFSVCSQANTISTFSERWKTGRFKEFQWDKVIPVEITTLDSLINTYGRPKYCKIDVEGYELEVLKGLSSRIPCISFEFCKEFVDDTERCVIYLMGLGYRHFNVALRESNKFEFSQSQSGAVLLNYLSSLEDSEEWGDIWVFANPPTEPFIGVPITNGIDGARTTLESTHVCGLTKPNQPLRLHLGCGENYLPGYLNIDYPPDQHNVLRPKADAYYDITKLDYVDETVDEIRLHHVFEHFNRVTALAMLIRWQRWLTIGGNLHIETPDILESARTMISSDSYRTKMGVVRHIVGDQAADWGYHVDQWFPERFERTLKALGFADIKVRCSNWEHDPFLSNVDVTAVKSENRSLENQLAAADVLLWDSTVSDVEKPTHAVWRKQLRNFFGISCDSEFALPLQARHGKATEAFSQFEPAQERTINFTEVLSKGASQLAIDEIQSFNQTQRDHWVDEKAKTILPGSRVLDVGAGTCLYRANFSHCDYKSHDFKRYEGYQNSHEGSYGQMDYVSDINAIPVADESFDVVVCTEVLEHVPEPIAAVREMARILKSGGRLLLTAPLGSGLHQAPYHYYGGFTPYWYRHFCEQFGLSVVEIVPNGGFFKLLAQECARVAWTMPLHERFHGPNNEVVGTLFGELLPRFLFGLEEKCFIDQFTVGYHVEAVKANRTK